MASQAAPSHQNEPEDVVVAEDVGTKRLAIALARQVINRRRLLDPLGPLMLRVSPWP